MNDSELAQLEAALLDLYIPGITKSHRKALRKLCVEKGIHIFSYKLQNKLTNLLASIIRHRETDYDSMCKVVGKEKARFYVQPIIDKGLGKEGK